MTEEERMVYEAWTVGWNEALEVAARIADVSAKHRKGAQGIWRARRAQIAADIRACKSELGSAQE